MDGNLSLLAFQAFCPPLSDWSVSTASAWSGPVLTSSPHQRFYILLFALPWRFSCTPALLTSCRYSAQVEGTAGHWHFYVLPAGFSLPMLEALGRLTKSSKRVTTELDWTLGALGGIPGIPDGQSDSPDGGSVGCFYPSEQRSPHPTSLNGNMWIRRVLELAYFLPQQALSSTIICHCTTVWVVTGSSATKVRKWAYAGDNIHNVVWWRRQDKYWMDRVQTFMSSSGWIVVILTSS